MDMTTEVSAGELIQQLETNLEIHKTDYEAALEGYRNKLTTVLNDLLKDVKNELDIDPHKISRLSKPQSHEQDYVQAIKMLKLRKAEDMIELGWDQFRQFWEDEWDWKTQFIASNSMYTGR